MEFEKWIKTSDQLPPEPINKISGDKYIATVIDYQVVAVHYARRLIRGKEVLRWEWEGRICPWDVIAYMPFPEPYKE